MTAYKGALLLLKVGNGDVSEVFTTLGGLQATEISLNNTPLDAGSLGNGSWRVLSAGRAKQNLSISGEGIFTDSSAESTVRGYAFLGDSHNYQLYFGNGDRISGSFIITRYARNGDMVNEEAYALTLESTGEISFLAA